MSAFEGNRRNDSDRIRSVSNADTDNLTLQRRKTSFLKHCSSVQCDSLKRPQTLDNFAINDPHLLRCAITLLCGETPSKKELRQYLQDKHPALLRDFVIDFDRYNTICDHFCVKSPIRLQFSEFNPKKRDCFGIQEFRQACEFVAPSLAHGISGPLFKHLDKFDIERVTFSQFHDTLKALE